MPDSKITALTSISTSTDPANDPLVIVDVSDTSMASSGTTKKVTLNNLLACSPTATLASATITGDLTVDTSTLKVDSANNRVGIGTATPANPLHISGTNPVPLLLQKTGSTDVYLSFTDSSGVFGYFGFSNGDLRFQTPGQAYANKYVISSDGTSTWSNVGGVAGTAMTLNANGLGIGVTPTSTHNLSSAGPIGISGTNSGTRTSYISNSGTCSIYYTDGGGSGYFADFGNLIIQPRTSAGRSVVIATSAAAGTPVERLIVDPNGNVGIGVTPSAWNSSYRGLQLGAGGAISAHTSTSLPWLVATSNSFINSAGDWKFINNGYSTRYLARGDDGTQSWWTSNNGSAGGTVSYTQAMTLDASGRLYINDTAQNYGSAYQVIKYSGTSIYGTSYKNGVSGNGTAVVFVNSSNALAGYIDTTNTTVTYASVSDYRLKEQVQPISGGLARINSLKPSVYKWKTDGSNGEGFLAHELAEVVPFAVTGEKDAVNEDGSIKPQGVDLSKVVPVLVAAIQELAAEVNALKKA